MYSSLMITKSPTFTTLVSIVLCITHVLILVLLILWLYITFVITPSKPLDYPVTLSINNTLRWGVALVNPVDVTISSFTYFILPNINDSYITGNLHASWSTFLLVKYLTVTPWFMIINEVTGEIQTWTIVRAPKDLKWKVTVVLIETKSSWDSSFE